MVAIKIVVIESLFIDKMIFSWYDSFG